jgi:hypothetical protein
MIKLASEFKRWIILMIFLPGMHVVARNYTRVKSVLCNMFAHFVFIFFGSLFRCEKLFRIFAVKNILIYENGI